MAGKSLGYVNKNLNYQKKQTQKKVAIIILLGFLAFVIAIGVFYNSNEKKYFMKDAYICSATIDEKGEDNNKYYVHLKILDNIQGANVKNDDLWKEVSSDFYNAHNTNQNVGILLGNYDVFKDNKYSKGQSFIESAWGIEEIYDNLEAAQKAYPKKNYSANGKVTKKKITKNNEYFFNIEVDERTMTAKVSKEMYEKTEVGKEVQCEIEALGELVKIKKVLE